jgi:hypothetical protein
MNAGIAKQKFIKVLGKVKPVYEKQFRATGWY